MTARLDREIALAMGELADAAPPARPFDELPAAGGHLSPGDGDHRTRWIAAAAAVSVIAIGVVAIAILPSRSADAPAVTDEEQVATTPPTPTSAPTSAPTPATTAPPTTTGPEPEPTATPIGRLVIGSSVTLGASPLLADAGFAVDATESRTFEDVVDLVDRLATTDRLGEVVVISAAVNAAIRPAQLDAVLEQLEDVDRVVLVTTTVEREYAADNNRLLSEAAAARDNTELLDWANQAATCPGDCFYEDGIHLRPDGQAFYTDLIVSAATSRSD